MFISKAELLSAFTLAAVAMASPLESRKSSDVGSEAGGVQPGLVIHAGAGTILREDLTPELERDYRAGLSAALKAGYSVLADGGSSVDAVEAAVNVLEDNPLFNAGRGAVFDISGRNVHDASIMEGSAKRRAGASSLTYTVKNPISLARRIMDNGRHVFLAGPGAEQFARSEGLETVDPSYFFTEKRYKSHLDGLATYDGPMINGTVEGFDGLFPPRASDDLVDVVARYTAEYMANKANDNSTEPLHKREASPDAVGSDSSPLGTVGAVAIDVNGTIAAATSTGGMTNKWTGRVGDSPLIGAGTWADNESCGLSATGSGEMFIRYGVAHAVSARVKYANMSLQDACDDALADVGSIGGDGGVIAVGKNGELVFSMNSAGMYRGKIGAVTDHRPLVAIYGDEEETEAEVDTKEDDAKTTANSE